MAKDREVHMTHCGPLNDGVCKYGDEDCPALSGDTKNLWTHEQVDNLNEYQVAGVMHPFTCGNEHPGNKVLVATVRGWICTGCDWTQDWAHPFMISGAAVEAARKAMKGEPDA